MGYRTSTAHLDSILRELSKEYSIYAPKTFVGEGTYSDTDRVRYGTVESLGEINFEVKSEFSYKEILTPISETLFYFTEDEVKVADGPKKGAIVFVRSCDLHAVKRMDDIYLKNGFEDFYYKRIREKTKFILMGCSQSFNSCFCVDMGTNKSDHYDAYIKVDGDSALIDGEFEALITRLEEVEEVTVKPDFVTENKTRVNIPENLSLDIMDSTMWNEYNERCIACGRCNFVCPTCTCFTMQDVFYEGSDRKQAGERRRVWASCQVNGYTDMAGGHSFRGDKGQRMRFKVLHKVYDYKKRFGYNMCVGCGRCDDICPEYISFSACINKLSDGMKEIEG
ncbi:MULTISPECIES: anaerobic sulfite reductase subunit AsrA [Zhenhengia]|uniref:Anaerobic sulfite reductase subunit A n=1 Tax=Zhenhengia yiwuensis TaxID=2763666 RepID=A0A926EIH3_9FIRM|nr:anaerobic sulfite reductase subunit AsrA [Zhenhengia yiwuensis]MBP3910739.1 anaerobic sulfite reductase subunit A [Niameybacter sp.]MBS5800224.1 anaerobic sulfite reductase subunit AsrA [Clostridiales bacterium]MBC8578792.1 anaerobic sulfite reductase subunit A [Zhenhengia yiwuensis]MDU6358671.1 anaerobic sulfite reductase subunit AsrA [Clostridiales bacterium]MDU6853121.1 anaerobic sulfite reductase subunit AsrA [Clostridiales bacterium]